MRQLQLQLAQATGSTERHQNELDVAAQKVSELEAQSSRSTTRTKKPMTYAGKGSVTNLAVRMDTYLRDMDDSAAVAVVLSCLSDPAHEWWIAYQSTGDGSMSHS